MVVGNIESGEGYGQREQILHKIYEKMTILIYSDKILSILETSWDISTKVEKTLSRFNL